MVWSDDLRRFETLGNAEAALVIDAAKRARFASARPMRTRDFSEDPEHVEPAIKQRGQQRDDDDSDHDSLPPLSPLPSLGQ
jgi:hypothetical protein